MANVEDCKSFKGSSILPPAYKTFRGCSSVGRAGALQASSHRFDSVYLQSVINEIFILKR